MPVALLDRLKRPFRRDASTSEKTLDAASKSKQRYNPPPGPVPLKRVNLPRVQPAGFGNLAVQGWTEVDLADSTAPAQPDQLPEAFTSLIAAGKEFFARPREYKESFAYHLPEERGWSRVEGEKELFTIRIDTEEALPPELGDAARHAWSTFAHYTHDALGRVAQTLDLPSESLTKFSDASLALGPKPQATMMRLFRYECNKPKLVSEPHSDLGLLSLVHGDQPGLEVWDRYSQDFFPLERSYTTPKATLLVGAQLARLTNIRYVPGGHQVRSYCETDASSPQYRYSVVFIQRAHWPVEINTDELTSSITGPFTDPLRGVTSNDLFKAITATRYSVNADLETRKKQRGQINTEKTSSGPIQSTAGSGSAASG